MKFRAFANDGFSRERAPLRFFRKAALALAVALTVLPVRSDGGSKLPKGYWSENQSSKILDKTLTIVLDPDLNHVTPPEREAVGVLLDVGRIMQELYETSLHHQARASYEALLKLHRDRGHPQATAKLLDLYRLFKGPVARTLENEMVPFLPVDEKAAGRNVYPWAVTKREVQNFLAAHPDEKASILGVRTIVRRATREEIESDLDVLDRHGVLDALHPGLREKLEALSRRPDPAGFYAVPYSVAYGDRIVEAQVLLDRAAAIVEKEDVDLARYLRQRSVDFLRDDYEGGDAAWVTGRFQNLNVQIGSYETYDDELFGVKSFFGLSLLVKNLVMSESLSAAVKGIQDIEDSLPYEPHKKVREDIPVGVYDVIADFGQARGTNTATILPNESYIVRKYGRTILLRYNILTDPDIFEIRRAAFDAAVAKDFHNDYHPRGDFFRTMWHEVGHYLGPDRDKTGRSLDLALEENSSILEELKADLVSLFVAKRMNKIGYYDLPRLKAVYSAGVRRVLQKNEPRKSQAYATMELMQMNYFLEQGLLEFDTKTKKLRIDYSKFHEGVAAMLREVLFLQYDGDKDAADRFIEKYTQWERNIHGSLARAMTDSETYRYAIVRYAALGE